MGALSFHNSIDSENLSTTAVGTTFITALFWHEIGRHSRENPEHRSEGSRLFFVAGTIIILPTVNSFRRKKVNCWHYQFPSIAARSRSHRNKIGCHHQLDNGMNARDHNAERPPRGPLRITTLQAVKEANILRRLRRPFHAGPKDNCSNETDNYLRSSSSMLTGVSARMLCLRFGGMWIHVPAFAETMLPPRVTVASPRRKCMIGRRRGGMFRQLLSGTEAEQARLSVVHPERPCG